MDLEELQLAWTQMSEQLENQKKLTDKIILQMTQDKYKNKFNKITIFESFGAILCFVAALYVIVNFYKLDTWYLIACGIFTLLFYLVMPVLVLRSLFKIKHMNIISTTYSETLIRYTKEKNRLLLLQKIGIVASLVMVFTVAVVFAKIVSDKDFFLVERSLGNYVAIVLSIVLIFFVARWGYNGYKKVTQSAEDILKQLNQ